jgi:hypothetical protein
MLYALWCAAIFVKGAAACRMAVNRTIRILPFVWCYVACTFVYLTLLLAFSPFPSVYLAAYSFGVPFLLALEFAATASMFWALTRTLHNVRMIGTAILCILTVVGAGAAWAISFLGPPVHASTTVVWLWSAAQAAQRYVSTITVVVLLSALFFAPRSPGQSMPRVAIHAAWSMIFDALMRLTGAMFERLFGYSHPFAAALVQLASGALAGLGWLTLGNYEETKISLEPEETVFQNGHLAFERNSIRAAIDEAIGIFQRNR